VNSPHLIILRDLNNKFCARFAIELLLCDKKAKAIGSNNITTRASLGAIIGEGNCQFFKYSMIGHIYLFTLIIMEKSCKNIPEIDTIQHNIALEEVLSRPILYRQLALFPGEILALKLALNARGAIEKFKNDYKCSGSYNLIEWRTSKAILESNHIQSTLSGEYKVLIHDDNGFQPLITASMKQNSKNLAKHLAMILRLQPDTMEDIQEERSINDHLKDHEIFEYATQHDLPIFVSIDGSIDDSNVATTSISIVAPDIRDTDEKDSMAWQNRLANVLLIRSWQSPKYWGTVKASINMAESLGFIIGEYTIPPDLPIIYITDSNNARTLQKKVYNSDDLTHWKKVRKFKQGIHYSIANHLEYLTSKWPREEQLCEHTKRLYK
jgi:hypothetical protein